MCEHTQTHTRNTLTLRFKVKQMLQVNFETFENSVIKGVTATITRPTMKQSTLLWCEWGELFASSLRNVGQPAHGSPSASSEALTNGFCVSVCVTGPTATSHKQGLYGKARIYSSHCWPRGTETLCERRWTVPPRPLLLSSLSGEGVNLLEGRPALPVAGKESWARFSASPH